MQADYSAALAEIDRLKASGARVCVCACARVLGCVCGVCVRVCVRGARAHTRTCIHALSCDRGICRAASAPRIRVFACPRAARLAPPAEPLSRNKACVCARVFVRVCGRRLPNFKLPLPPPPPHTPPHHHQHTTPFLSSPAHAPSSRPSANSGAGRERERSTDIPSHEGEGAGEGRGGRMGGRETERDGGQEGGGGKGGRDRQRQAEKDRVGGRDRWMNRPFSRYPSLFPSFPPLPPPAAGPPAEATFGMRSAVDELAIWMRERGREQTATERSEREGADTDRHRQRQRQRQMDELAVWMSWPYLTLFSSRAPFLQRDLLGGGQLEVRPRLDRRWSKNSALTTAGKKSGSDHRW